MKKILSAALVCAMAISCNSNETKKDEAATPAADTTSTVKKDEVTPPAPMPDSATMMKNWEAYSTPGDMHKLMATWDGKWDGEVSMWMAPGAPPQTSKATSVNKMVMGGRYQLMTNSGNMMGMPFEGTGTLAYDNAKKKFISTWIDNMGTGIMVLEGTWDDATKTMNLSGKCVDPGMGDGREMTVRETFRVIDDKTHQMEMFAPAPDGKEFKTMEIKFTRK
jgi:hypothetical protein